MLHGGGKVEIFQYFVLLGTGVWISVQFKFCYVFGLTFGFYWVFLRGENLVPWV